MHTGVQPGKSLPGSAALAGSGNASRSADAPDRRLFLVFAGIAVVYAFLANVRNVADADFFWQLSSGRWVLQHHHLFSTDVFSYTAPGQPWIYPAGAGLIFYLAYLIGGYVLISYLGAAACASTVALLLRRGSAVAAAVAILAVPAIAGRTVPRAEMFTVVLFAAFLSILWENYQNGQARLWLLPLLMIVWANLHLGFIAGLALFFAFEAIELLEMFFPGSRRAQALQRLRRSLPWFAATALSTLVNPWGWNLYSALIRQDRAMALHSGWIAEWGRVPLNWTSLMANLSFRNPSSTFYLLALAGVIAIVAALVQRQVGPAILLAGALYVGAQHVRLDALTACVVVILGGSYLASAFGHIVLRTLQPRMRFALTAGLAALLTILVVVRCFDLVTNRRAQTTERFGAGLSWWLPERAASYIEKQNLPGQVFNTYDIGGYLTWRLGPQRRDYVDGRAIPFGPDIFRHEAELVQSSLDSDVWREEAQRYNINTILLPLLRYENLGPTLENFCQSKDWRPVYLDEISAVFVRRTPETQDLISRSPIDCSTAPLPNGPPAESADAAFNQWANAAGVLANLGRYSEALAATEKAAQIYPDNFFVTGLRGSIFQAMELQSDAEREYRKAAALEPSAPGAWFVLAALYKDEGHIPESIAAQKRALDLSSTPQSLEWVKLAQLYLDVRQPKAALSALDSAVGSAPPDLLEASGPRSFRYDVAVTQATAWRSLGDTKRAAWFDERAVRALVPPQH